MRRWILALAMTASLTRVAHADDAEQPEKRAWYGWQILIVDSALIGLASVATFTPQQGANAGVFGLDALAFWCAAPIVHQLHGPSSLASFGLHFGMPFAGALVGLVVGSLVDPCAATPRSFDFCFIARGAGPGAGAGVLAGAGVAMLIDSFAFAWEPARDSASSSSSSWTFAPHMFARGATLTLGRAF